MEAKKEAYLMEQYGLSEGALDEMVRQVAWCKGVGRDDARTAEALVCDFGLADADARELVRLTEPQPRERS